MQKRYCENAFLIEAAKDDSIGKFFTAMHKFHARRCQRVSIMDGPDTEIMQWEQWTQCGCFSGVLNIAFTMPRPDHVWPDNVEWLPPE